MLQSGTGFKKTTMKDLKDFISSYKSRCEDSRDLERLLQFCSWKMIPMITGYDTLAGCSKEAWMKRIYRPFNRENILKELEADVIFGSQKAADRRGLSAGLIFECVRMWNDILEEGLEDWPDDKYAPYGMPLFEATAKKYGFSIEK